MMKKIITLLIAVSMILCLGAVSAFAANDNDATVTGNKVYIGKTFKLENDKTTSPAETFYLLQTRKTSVESSVTGDDIPDLVAITDAGYTDTGRLVGKTTFAEGAATLAGTRQDIEIGLPAYTAVGVYTYTLHEVDNATAGVTYWNNDIMLIITVCQNDDGKFYVEAVHCEERIIDAPADEQPAKSDNFTNIYSANSFDPDTGGLRIEKEVTGYLGDRDKYFDFTVTFTAKAGKNYATAPTVTVSPTSNTSNPTSLDFTDLSATNPTKTVTFKLKHGETIAFGNVPYGVTYTYAEADYSGDGYTTTYPQKDSVDEVDPETGKPVKVNDTTDVVNSISKSYKVTNDKNPELDTGIFGLDNLPYIMALAVVLIAGAALVLRSRRNADLA